MSESVSGPGEDATSESNATEPVAGPRRRRRWMLLSGGLCLGVLLLGLGWIVVTGLLAKSKLEHAQADLPALRASLLSGDTATSQRLAADIASDASAAHGLTTGPAWWVGANLPWLGTPLATTRAVAVVSDRIGADAVPGIVALADSVERSELGSDGRIPVARLAAAQPTIARAADTLAAARADLSGTARSTWLSAVDHDRTALEDRITTLGDDLEGARTALTTALPMLGQRGPRRYFVGFMNEAEARGLGGVPGAFAILAVDHGRFHFTHFGNDNELRHISADIDLGADFRARYASADPTGTFANSDISPDFPDAARIWASMWQRKSGQRIDGAIALDPTALSYLMKVTGPARIAGGGTVDAGNVVALTQQAEYAKYPNDLPARKKFVVAVSEAVAHSVTSGHGGAAALLAALVRGVRERRIVVWSAQPAEESALIASGYAGTLPSGAGPVTGLTVVNAAGSKLDYYLHASMTYRRVGCGTASTAQATITLRNEAPRSGLPPYVTLRVDKPAYRTAPGDNFVIVSYYGSSNTRTSSVTLDDRPVGYAAGRENGLSTTSLGVELPVGRTRTVTVDLREPAATSSPAVFVQPAVHPIDVTLTGDDCP